MTTDHARIQSLIRPSENLKCILNVHLAPENTRIQDQSSTPFPPRLIAIVTHRFHSQDTELGSLLVLNPSVADGLPRVVEALPITEYMAVAVAQRGPLDSCTAECDPNVPTEMWSAWHLSIRRDVRDSRPLTCIVRTRDTQKLQSFTAECRRLKEIATTSHPVSNDFTWVEAYFLDPSSRRFDLRLRKQPLHTRLSHAIAGFPGNDVSDISIVQRDWIEQVALKEASSGNVRHLKIRLGTFNVNGKGPSQDLYPWIAGSQSRVEPETAGGWISPLKLSPFEVSSGPLRQELRGSVPLPGTTDEHAFGEPDLLVLGFQEADLSTEALLYATSTVKEDQWLTAIFAALGEKSVLYEKLTSRQLVGMLLIIVVKKAIVPCFTDIRSCDAGSGIMGFMGNKGATAIRLEITPKEKDPQIATCCSTVLTFVNAHLAASDEMIERRNYDFQELSGRLVFSPHGSSENYPLTSPPEDIYNIYQSDVLFWMGDLNYRLNLPDGDIRELLFSHIAGTDSIQTLLLYDQLRTAIRNNKAFTGFLEHHITHIPTYRLALGVSKDRLGYDMKRKPAWTDRILYMAPPDMAVAQVAYRSHPEIAMSDHKPVSADFDISLPLIDKLQYESVISVLHRELAGFEGTERRPKIKIQPASIDFGTINYKQIIHRKVMAENEGDIPCVFRFIRSTADSDHIAPSWLRVEPIVGLLRPHESTTILLSSYVDDDSAAKLNLNSPMLEYTLVLHTALGKDDFLTVSGDYQYTCFANTLERLVRLPGPIRRLKSPEEVLPPEQAISAPREIMRLINWMMTHASATDALFDYPGQEHLCHVIRECLDTGDEFPLEDPDRDERALAAAFASTLVSFLDSLIEPVVPARLHAQCLQAKDKDEAFEALNAFPHENINVWISLMAFLHYIAKQGDNGPANPRKADKLASIFAPILLRDDPTGGHPRASPVGKRDFLHLFID